MDDLHQLRKDFKTHAEADEAFQKESLGRHKDIQDRLAGQPTKEDIALIVEQVIRATLLSKGRTLYSALIVVAVVIGSIITIFGGFKTLAAFLFFPRV